MNTIYLLLLLPIFISPSPCSKYNCSGPTPNPSANPPSCLSQPADGKTLVYTCPKSPPNKLETWCALGDCIEIPKALPGMKTPDAGKCLSKQEEHGYCSGKLTGESCLLNSECDVGLFCANFQCTPYFSGGDCLEYLSCPALHGCHHGKCVKFGTLPTGTQLKMGYPGLWDVWMCEGFWADPVTKKCVDQGFTISTSKSFDSSQNCDVVYNGEHVAGKWTDTHDPSNNLLTNYIATGSCCYNADGLASCNLPDTITQKKYVQQIMEFMEDNKDLIVTYAEPIVNKWSSLGLAPVQEKVSGFDGALKAYCNLFYAGCKDAVSCMQPQISSLPNNLLKYCFEKGAYKNNLVYWILAIGAVFTIAAITIALIIIL